jgi:DNA-binding response OmpR family regulator
MGERKIILPMKKLLLVDEDLDSLRFCSTLLRQQGYDVRACASYAEAVARLETETFDFILVDQGGPGFEGRVVLDRARETEWRPPVLVMARCAEVNCYLEAMERGAVDYLEKPIPAAYLSRLVEAHGRADRCAA